MKCTCRMCSKPYDPAKSRADYKGYCSQACMKAKARVFGWRPYKRRLDPYGVFGVYETLRRHKEIGDLINAPKP